MAKFCSRVFSDRVRLAATTALYNSLEFTKGNFDKEVKLFSICKPQPGLEIEPVNDSHFVYIHILCMV